jgi:uncharacterized repeat protein (TIGR01451 family)
MQRFKSMIILTISIGLLVYGFATKTAASASDGDLTLMLPPRPTVSPLTSPSNSKKSSANNIVVWMQSDRQEASPGDRITLKVTVTNQDDDVARGVEIRLPVTSGLEPLGLITDQGWLRYNSDNRTFKVLVGTLKPGKSVNISLATQVTQKATETGSLYNFAALIFKTNAKDTAYQLSNQVNIRITGK